MKKSKKIIIIASILIVIFAFTIVFTGCTSNTFTRLTRALNQTAETTQNLDTIANEDLTENTVSDLSQSYQNTAFLPINMSTSTLSMNLSFGEIGVVQLSSTNTIDKISNILNTREELKNKQVHMNQIREDIKIKIENIKSNIKAYSKQDNKLSEEENSIIDSYIDEILEIKATLEGTIGEVYPRIKELRGKYKLENIDLINNTYNEVLDVVNIRVQNFDRLAIIANDIDTILSSKLEQQ